jgi:hypothetical protein
MTNQIDALKLALEALENSVDLVREDAYNAEKLYGNYPTRQGKVRGLKVLADDHEKAITAIKQALEQPVQEPVAWLHPANATCVTTDPTAYARGIPLYTTPPAAPAQEIVCSTGLCHYRKPQEEPVAHCEAGPEFCPVCRAETHSLALAAAVGYIQRHTPTIVWTEICRVLDKSSPAAPDLQAELDATNRQVEILSDALAESRREVASLTAVQEPVQNIEHCIWARNGNTPCPHTTSPAAQRPWVGLTDEQRSAIIRHHPFACDIIRVTAAKIKELNT